jgi:hypothetical protein
MLALNKNSYLLRLHYSEKRRIIVITSHAPTPNLSSFDAINLEQGLKKAEREDTPLKTGRYRRRLTKG